MAKSKKGKNGMEVVPDGAMSADELQEIMARQGEPVEASEVHSAPVVSKLEKTPDAEKPDSDAVLDNQDEDLKKELSEIEKKIESEFADGEKKFVRQMVDSYAKELQAARTKIEKDGGTFDKKRIELIRLSYIGDRVRFGVDKKRWGVNGPLAPEKAKLFEKYLKLKLLDGIPPEKPENKPAKPEEIYTKEKNFTPEQSSKLLALIIEARKVQAEMDPEDFQEAIEEIIREDLIGGGIFSEEDFSRAFGHAIKWIQKFNDKK